MRGGLSQRQRCLCTRVGTTGATSARRGLATSRAAVARAHAQSLINAAPLAFAMGELTSSKDFATASPR